MHLRIASVLPFLCLVGCGADAVATADAGTAPGDATHVSDLLGTTDMMAPTADGTPDGMTPTPDTTPDGAPPAVDATVAPSADPCALAGPGELDPATAGLSDLTRYTAPFDVSVTGDTLVWSNPSGDVNYASVRNMDWAVEPGQTYVLRARFALAPSTRGVMSVATYAEGTPKDELGDPTINSLVTTPWGVSRMRDGASDNADWQPLCLAFTPAPGETLGGLRITGFGADEKGAASGSVRLRDVRLERVAPVGTWIRFAATGPGVPLTVSLLWSYPVYPDVHPAFPVTLPADGTFSEWVDATRFSPGGPLTNSGLGATAAYGLSFLDPSGTAVAEGALSVEVTTDPSVPRSPPSSSSSCPMRRPICPRVPG